MDGQTGSWESMQVSISGLRTVALNVCGMCAVPSMPAPDDFQGRHQQQQVPSQCMQCHASLLGRAAMTCLG